MNIIRREGEVVYKEESLNKETFKAKFGQFRICIVTIVNHPEELYISTANDLTFIKF